MVSGQRTEVPHHRGPRTVAPARPGADTRLPAGRHVEADPATRPIIRFSVLGPVEAHLAGRRIELAAAKLRTVLAALVLGRQRLVPDSRLAEMLWGDDPPATADAQIQTYVSRLRKKFGELCTVVRQRPGYLLEIGPNQVDLFEFERFAAAGREALVRGRTVEAAATLRQALALWTGPALSGVTDFLSSTVRPNLEEARLTVLEDRIDADIMLDRYPEMTAELTGLVAAYPLRERLRGQLMTVLHRTGRQAEALASYQEHRRLLVEDLGIDPGAGLQEIHESILTAAPVPTEPVTWTPRPAPPSPPQVVPAQLPPDIADFTGRQLEVDRLAALLCRHCDGSPPLNACSIAGMAGTGKTALAVHVAHQCRHEFPDGQLYLDLRGTGTRPVEPAEALAMLLIGLGVGAEDVPAGFDERVKLYRSRLAGRRVLVVLDNAANEQQIRPLLPGTAGCYLLVTGRARLSALEGAPLIDLTVLEHDDALALLAKIVGGERLAVDAEHAHEIVRLCGCLPLGVRIAGAKLLAKPHWRLADLADRLADQRNRLDELRFADLDVRASVSLSYRGLPAPARRAFRLLALLSAPRFSVWAAAVVLDVTVAAVRELIEQLVDVRLLEVSPGDAVHPVRYSFHDLVRALALERVADEETAEERYAALHRAHASMGIAD